MSTKWHSDNVIANGIKIHYHRTGGDKPPVVLAHGITDNGLCWTRLAQALEKEYDVIMFDARGHGLSEAPERGYARGDHAADLAGLVPALDLERPAFIGHSMGAANVAAAVASYPDLVRCAVLEDPPWQQTFSVEERTATARTWRTEIIDRKFQTREEIIAELRAQHPTWAEVEWGPWADANLQVSPNVFDWLGAGAVRTPWQEIVRQITCPMLLVTGDPELGAIVTAEVAREVVGLCRSARVAHIKGAGHSIRREQYEKYVEVVWEFLSEVWAGK